jgi:hypothetical protein
MPNNDFGQILHNWQFPERQEYERGRLWYIIAGLIVATLLIYALLTQNFLFALMIILFAVVVLFSHARGPAIFDFTVTDKGLAVNSRLYAYDELQSFWIIDEPTVKKLYFSFQSSMRPPLAVFITEQNPEDIRQTLRNYLPEDTEQKDELLSDLIWRVLKL